MEDNSAHLFAIYRQIEPPVNVVKYTRSDKIMEFFPEDITDFDADSILTMLNPDKNCKQYPVIAIRVLQLTACESEAAKVISEGKTRFRIPSNRFHQTTIKDCLQSAYEKHLKQCGLKESNVECDDFSGTSFSEEANKNIKSKKQEITKNKFQKPVQNTDKSMKDLLDNKISTANAKLLVANNNINFDNMFDNNQKITESHEVCEQRINILKNENKELVNTIKDMTAKSAAEFINYQTQLIKLKSDFNKEKLDLIEKMTSVRNNVDDQDYLVNGDVMEELNSLKLICAQKDGQLEQIIENNTSLAAKLKILKIENDSLKAVNVTLLEEVDGYKKKLENGACKELFSVEGSSKAHQMNAFDEEFLGCTAFDKESIHSSPILSFSKRTYSSEKRNGSPIALSTTIPDKKTKLNDPIINLESEKNEDTNNVNTDENSKQKEGEEIISSKNIGTSKDNNVQVINENSENDKSVSNNVCEKNLNLNNYHFLNMNTENLKSLHKIKNVKLDKSYEEEPSHDFQDFYPYVCKFANKKDVIVYHLVDKWFIKASKWTSMLNRTMTTQSAFIGKFLWEMYGTKIAKKSLNPNKVPGSEAFTPTKYDVFCKAHDAYIIKNGFLGKQVEEDEISKDNNKSVYKKSNAQRQLYVSQLVKRAKDQEEKKKKAEEEIRK